MPRWLPLLFLATGLSLGACGPDQPPAPVEVKAGPLTAAATSPAPATPPPAPKVGATVTVFSDGSAELRPPVGDVAMLRRMPDGTFKRVCGKPDQNMRDMIEAKRRQRRGTP